MSGWGFCRKFNRFSIAFAFALACLGSPRLLAKEVSTPRPLAPCKLWLQRYKPDSIAAFVASYLPKPIFNKHLTPEGQLPFSPEDLKFLYHFISKPRAIELDFRSIFETLPSYIADSKIFVDVFRVAAGLEASGYQILGIMKIIDGQEVDLIVSKTEGSAILLEFKARLIKIDKRNPSQFIRLRRLVLQRVISVEGRKWEVKSAGVVVTSPGSEAFTEIILKQTYGFSFLDLSDSIARQRQSERDGTEVPLPLFTNELPL